MEINRLIFCLLSLFLSHHALATLHTPDLSEQISAHIESYGKSLTAKGYRFDYQIGNIDPRLSIGRCDSDLNIEFLRNPLEQAQNTIKINCLGEQPWKLFVATTLNIYGPIMVLDIALARGEAIQANMLSMKETQINRSRQALFSEPGQVIGKIAKRSIRAGQALSPNLVKAPNLVTRGDQVTIVAQNNAISIKMNGTALSHGALGDQISVRNDRSERIIKAKVVDRGRVLVTM